MKIAVLFWPGIEDVPNRAINQRLSYLAARHDVVLFTSSGGQVPTSLAAALTWRRPPRLPALPAALDLRMLRLAWQAVAALWQIGWTVASVCVEPGLADGIVYSFQRPEAAIAWVASHLGFLWVADLLDMPDLFVEDRWFKRTWDRQLRLRLFLYRYIFRLPVIFGRADLVFAIAHARDRGCARRLVEEFHVRPERLQPLTNGVDLSAIHPAGHRPPADRFRLIHAGPLGHGRDTDTLMQAILLALDRVPDLQLLLAGGVAFGYEDRLQQHIDRIRAASARNDTVCWLGFVPHGRALQLEERSHVGLVVSPASPTKEGAMPIKLLEYRALGRPAIAPDMDGMRGMIDPGVNGLLYRPSDPRALADAIIWCAEHPAEVERMSAAARAGLARFDWQRINAAVNATIVELVGASAAKRRLQRRALGGLARILSRRPTGAGSRYSRRAAPSQPPHGRSADVRGSAVRGSQPGER